MIYADYTYYTDSYGGRAVNQEDFLRLAAGASAYLDRVTFGRAEEHSEDDLLLCALRYTRSYSGHRRHGQAVRKRGELVVFACERLSGNSRGADVQAVSDLASCGVALQRGG